MKYKAFSIDSKTFEQNKKPMFESDSYAEIDSKLRELGFSFKTNENFKVSKGLFIKTTFDNFNEKEDTQIVIITES